MNIEGTVMNNRKMNSMAKLSCKELPPIPDDVRIQVSRWDSWWECEVKGDTLCMCDAKGVVAPSDIIWVSGNTIAADCYANVLRDKGFKFVGVGFSEDEPSRSIISHDIGGEG